MHSNGESFCRVTSRWKHALTNTLINYAGRLKGTLNGLEKYQTIQPIQQVGGTCHAHACAMSICLTYETLLHKLENKPIFPKLLELIIKENKFGEVHLDFIAYMCWTIFSFHEIDVFWT